jgi:hypothetical protein
MHFHNQIRYMTNHIEDNVINLSMLRLIASGIVQNQAINHTHFVYHIKSGTPEWISDWIPTADTTDSYHSKVERIVALHHGYVTGHTIACLLRASSITHVNRT